MRVKIRQDKSVYSINIHDGVTIWRHQIWLKSRRILRLLKRIITYMRRLSVVFIIALIFIVVIIPAGIKLEKYDSWVNGFWDMRFFLLTSIFITLFSTIYASESKRHEILIRQNNMYNDFLYECDLFIASLCEIVGFEYSDSIFITEKHSLIFLDILKNNEHNCNDFVSLSRNRHELFDRKLYFLSILRRFEVHVKEIYSYVTNEKIIGYCEYKDRRRFIDIFPQLFNVQIAINNATDEDLIKEITEFLHSSIFWDIYYALASMRRPWRWDFARNQEIRQLLIIKGEMIKGFYDFTRLWNPDIDNSISKE